MPVIELSLSKLKAYAEQRASESRILEILPYLGLDIESQEGDSVSVEYSPNRPDFSSESGIARSLVGLLGIKTGLPTFDFGKSSFKVTVERDGIRTIRPYIYGLCAEIEVTEDIIRQLITMQEDLHNGLGRRRSKVAIGIHNASVIGSEIVYRGTRDENYSFLPLGSSHKMTIEQVLKTTEQGISYGRLVSSGIYPILEDSEGNLLSMPPIINGELTRLKAGVTRLFVDVTGTEEKACDVSIAIIASMLYDIGAKVSSVRIERGDYSFDSPDMQPREMKFDLRYTNKLLGFDFSQADASSSLAKSRIHLADSGIALIPRFRADIIHPVDLAEEVALGYGIWNIGPQTVETSLVGRFNPKLRKMDRMVDALVGLGLTEIWNLSLASAEEIRHCEQTEVLKVEDTKSLSFEYLRCDLISSLMRVLGASTHQEYPQKLFELAPVFRRSDKSVSLVGEEDHVAVVIAASDSTYSVIRSTLDGFLRLVLPNDVKVGYAPTDAPLFVPGRVAAIWAHTDGNSKEIGVVGEIAPASLESYGLKVPVSSFEVNLEHLLKD